METPKDFLYCIRAGVVKNRTEHSPPTQDTLQSWQLPREAAPDSFPVVALKPVVCGGYESSWWGVSRTTLQVSCGLWRTSGDVDGQDMFIPASQGPPLIQERPALNHFFWCHHSFWSLLASSAEHRLSLCVCNRALTSAGCRNKPYCKTALLPIPTCDQHAVFYLAPWGVLAGLSAAQMQHSYRANFIVICAQSLIREML